MKKVPAIEGLLRSVRMGESVKKATTWIYIKLDWENV